MTEPIRVILPDPEPEGFAAFLILIGMLIQFAWWLAIVLPFKALRWGYRRWRRTTVSTPRHLSVPIDEEEPDVWRLGY